MEFFLLRIPNMFPGLERAGPLIELQEHVDAAVRLQFTPYRRHKTLTITSKWSYISFQLQRFVYVLITIIRRIFKMKFMTSG